VKPETARRETVRGEVTVLSRTRRRQQDFAGKPHRQASQASHTASSMDK